MKHSPMWHAFAYPLTHDKGYLRQELDKLTDDQIWVKCMVEVFGLRYLDGVAYEKGAKVYVDA